MSQQILSTNTFTTAKWIVSSTASDGTHTTIAAALTSASSGDTIFIRPGTYTENPTLKAGVNLSAFVCDAFTPNVTIIGTCTLTAAGTVSISGIQLQTNSAALLAVTGSAASIVNLINCYLNCTNNTGITHSSSASGANVNLFSCRGNLGTTGIGIFTSTSAGNMTFLTCDFANSGASTTANTVSTGAISANYSKFANPFTSSSTGSIILNYCDIDCAPLNTTAMMVGGSGTHSQDNCKYLSGSASSISISTTLTMNSGIVNSSNTNPVTGAGTLVYSPMNFSGTGKVNNTTTQTPLNYGTWTPTIDGAVSGTTTYTTQQGYYTIVGNLVYIEGFIVITAATGTGNATIGGLPFTVKNLTNYRPVGNMSFSATWVWTGTTTQLNLRPITNTTTCTILGAGSAVGTTNLTMTNAAASIVFSSWYQI